VSYQSDYILRMIEQFAQAIATLRNRLLGRDPDREPLIGEVRAIADRADVNFDLARTVDTETLRMLMTVGGELDRGRCWLTAELLVLEAHDAGRTGDGETAKAAATRALELYSCCPGTGARSPTSLRCHSGPPKPAPSSTGRAAGPGGRALSLESTPGVKGDTLVVRVRWHGPDRGVQGCAPSYRRPTARCRRW
jgi:hypothetical protein